MRTDRFSRLTTQINTLAIQTVKFVVNLAILLPKFTQICTEIETAKAAMATTMIRALIVVTIVFRNKMIIEDR